MRESITNRESLSTSRSTAPAEDNLLAESRALAYGGRQPQFEQYNGQAEDQERSSRSDRRQERREKIKGFIKGITGGAEIKDVATKLQDFLAFMQDVQGMKVKLDEQGKFNIELNRGSDSTIAINKKEGLAEVTSIDLAKDISFRIAATEAGALQLENIKGIKVHAKIWGKEFAVNLQTAKLDKKDGKPALLVELCHPEKKELKFNILVPLDRRK